jgi:hypothetical protein
LRAGGLLLCLLFFVAAFPVSAAAEPPVEGRPPDFSGAVGKYHIKATAEPTTLRAEDPLLLTLTVTGSADNGQPPRRPNLRSLERLNDLFQIENNPEEDDRPDDGTWRFSYRLRPRSERVQKIPRLRFVYYNPAAGYETSYTSAIPLAVRRRAAASQIKRWQPNGAEVEQPAPLITGEAVLDRQAPDELPPPAVNALLALLAPLGCLVWWQVWRRWYPDAARTASLRRSGASRRALKALRAVPRGAAPAEAGAAVAGVLTRYLRQRLELSAEELTPFEITAHLKLEGVSDVLAGRFADLWSACDAARFAPDFAPARGDLADRAAGLISQMEAEPCWSRAS